MPVNRLNPESVEKYNQYQKKNQKEHWKRYYKYDADGKRKYYMYKKISNIFRNILLEN